MMRKLLPRLIALALMFGVGLGLYFIWHSLADIRRLPKTETELVGFLLPAKQSNPLLSPFSPKDADPRPSKHFMIFAMERQVLRTEIDSPISEPTTDPYLIENTCGLLIVSVDGGRNLKLNLDSLGTLDNLGELRERLTQLFHERERNRAFSPGMEGRGDLPLSERIVKTVLIQASRSLTYGEVVSILDAVKRSGANVIGLQINELEKLEDSKYEFPK
jgi:hypothetical protein